MIQAQVSEKRRKASESEATVTVDDYYCFCAPITIGVILPRVRRRANETRDAQAVHEEKERKKEKREKRKRETSYPINKVCVQVLQRCIIKIKG